MEGLIIGAEYVNTLANLIKAASAIEDLFSEVEKHKNVQPAIPDDFDAKSASQDLTHEATVFKNTAKVLFECCASINLTAITSAFASSDNAPLEQFIGRTNGYLKDVNQKHLNFEIKAEKLSSVCKEAIVKCSASNYNSSIFDRFGLLGFVIVCVFIGIFVPSSQLALAYAYAFSTYCVVKIGDGIFRSNDNVWTKHFERIRNQILKLKVNIYKILLVVDYLEVKVRNLENHQNYDCTELRDALLDIQSHVQQT